MDSEQVLERLKQMSMAYTRSERESDVDANLRTLMNDVPSLLRSDYTDKDQKSLVLTEMFRFLRNAVANSESRQLTVARSASFEIILSWITQLTTAVCGEADKPSSVQRGELLQLRCAIQFLGNLIAGNIDNKMTVWKTLISLFSLWLGSKDEALSKYAAMVLYNEILGVSSHREELLSSEDSVKITVSLLDSTSEGCEWALFVLENFLESAQFMESCHCLIPKKLRVALLDVLCVKLSRDSSPSIPCQTLEFVIREFEAKADSILSTSCCCTDDNLEPLQAVKCLEILCDASAKPTYQEHLQKSSSVLCSSIYLLKSVHLAGKQSCSRGSSKDKPTLTYNSKASDDFPKDPAEGFKKNLIRLIANQCWRHLGNQDLVRELDGIPLLLDCCKLDAQNPFIIEWVIFAIHNLCEGNAKNQELVGKMQLQNTVEPSVLGGFRLPTEESHAATVPLLQTSRSEQIRDDIRDLMQ